MKNKPLLIVLGEPNSIFSEIFFKSLKIRKFKSPIILIASYDLIKLQMKKLNINEKVEEIAKFQTNNQLSQFSNMYFNKIKKDLTINDI